MYLAGVIMHTVSLIFSLINHWRRRAGSFRECLDAPGGVMERVWGEDWAEGEGITSYDRSREGRRRHSIGIQTRSEVMAVGHLRMKTERGLGLDEIDCYKENRWRPLPVIFIME